MPLQTCGHTDPFRGFPPVIIRPPSKNVGADALIGPPRNAVPVPAKSQLPGNPREVRTTFSAENGCCAPREPADIGCLLRNRIQNLPFRQRYAGKTVHLCCRSPHGERGLKCQSLAAAGSDPGRSPHGERGLKSSAVSPSAAWKRSLPHGERGLKFCTESTVSAPTPSLPPRGAWIEMPF